MNKYLQGKSNYDKFPIIKLKKPQHPSITGWKNICNHLLEQLQKIPTTQKLIVIECYQGVLDEEIIPALQNNLQGKYFFSKDCMLAEKEIDSLVYPEVTDDEV